MHLKKAKGDVGVAFVIARLAELGWNVGIPLTEHARYDLFAEKDGHVHTVQVRYAAAKQGCIRVSLSASWADRHGNHRRNRCSGDFTILAVYTPQDGVFFLKDDDLGTNGREISLRLKPARNGQLKHVRNAEAFRAL
jgi:hypothetical protein